MSILDKAIAAVTPPESAEQRAEARARARELAQPRSWFAMILDHHEGIEQAFAAVKSAPDAAARRAAEKTLATLLTGHAMAEEAVVYPALAHAGDQGQANMAYTEQVAAKMQMAALQHLDPMGEDYLDKLGHLEGAVAHHVYEEESKWFPDLAATGSDEDHAQVTARYSEEYERYMGGGRTPGGETRAPLELRSFDAPSTSDRPL